jgi:hypothetical protein
MERMLNATVAVPSYARAPVNVTARGLIVKELLVALVKLVAEAVITLPEPAALTLKPLNVAVPLPALVPISIVFVPCKEPVPEVSVRVTILLVPRPVVERLPNWSCDLTTGCVLKTEPYVADPGCVVNVSLLAVPTTCDNDPKFVVPFTIPDIVAVPGFAAVRNIFPLEGIAAPSVDRTCIPLIVNVSDLFALPSVDRVTVTTEEVTDTLAELISRLLVNETLPTPALNCHPPGAVNINVLLV